MWVFAWPWHPPWGCRTHSKDRWTNTRTPTQHIHGHPSAISVPQGTLSHTPGSGSGTWDSPIPDLWPPSHASQVWLGLFRGVTRLAASSDTGWLDATRSTGSMASASTCLTPQRGHRGWCLVLWGSLCGLAHTGQGHCGVMVCPQCQRLRRLRGASGGSMPRAGTRRGMARACGS